MSKSPRRRLPRVTQDEYATIQGQFVHFNKYGPSRNCDPFINNNFIEDIKRVF